jgi:hypothetical protein
MLEEMRSWRVVLLQIHNRRFTWGILLHKGGLGDLRLDPSPHEALVPQKGDTRSKALF